jgi:hypothetical protein
MPLSLTQNKLMLERSGRTRGDSRPPVPGAVALAAAVFFFVHSTFKSWCWPGSHIFWDKFWTLGFRVFRDGGSSSVGVAGRWYIWYHFNSQQREHAASIFYACNLWHACMRSIHAFEEYEDTVMNSVSPQGAHTYFSSSWWPIRTVRWLQQIYVSARE